MDKIRATFNTVLSNEKVQRLTAEQRKILVDFIRTHAPQYLDKAVRTEFFTQSNRSPDWVALLDAQKEPVGLEVHVSLWRQLFG